MSLDASAQQDTTTDSAPEVQPADSDSTEPQQADPQLESSKRGRPKGATARKTRTVQLTLTVTGTAEGEWQAELKHGTKWVARGLRIPASAVSRAAKELHDELATGIDEVINAARDTQRKKLEELEAEMAKVKQALAELEE
ncbi:MAG: DUF6319 family protein [Sciscionella sp.]